MNCRIAAVFSVFRKNCLSIYISKKSPVVRWIEILNNFWKSMDAVSSRLMRGTILLDISSLEKPASLMAWWCICACRMGGLLIWIGNNNPQTYVEFLAQHMPPIQTVSFSQKALHLSARQCCITTSVTKACLRCVRGWKQMGLPTEPLPSQNIWWIMKLKYNTEDPGLLSSLVR